MLLTPPAVPLSLLLPCKGLKCGAVAAASAPAAAPEKQELELMQPDFYTMGHRRFVRAYGVHFKEGPQGVGVYAAKDMTDIERPRLILEIPMELLVTCSKYKPWMFFPNIVPVGHPVFEVIESTDPDTEYDIRLACLLLLALDQEGNFWKLYGDYLPNKAESPDLLLATEEELAELQDDALAERLRNEQLKIHQTWKEHFHPGVPLKLKRLARDSDMFKWAVGMVRSRSHSMKMSIGARIQDADVLSPYADMLNHSFFPNCSLRWRGSDRVLEVVVRVNQEIKAGDEMTLNYLPRKPTQDYIHRFGFSSSMNPFAALKFSGSSKIHRESFLSAFNIMGVDGDYFFLAGSQASHDPMANENVLAAARFLPFWSEEDVPSLPSAEKRAVKRLQKECKQLLASFPTTYEEDVKIYAAGAEERSMRWKAAVKYRMNEKEVIRKTVQILEAYLSRIMF